jgi:Protein DA1
MAEGPSHQEVDAGELAVTCTVCHQPPAAPYVLSLHGEVTCADHPVLGRCVLCARPRSENSAGWSQFTIGTTRCPTCAGNAVETQQQARAHIPLIRREMSAAGIELPTRVRVELRDPDALGLGAPRAGSGMCLGITRTVEWSRDGACEVIGIEIARGLTPVHFGQTVAHEIGHAWLAQRGAKDLEHKLAEGVCELFAGAWLKRRGGSFASALRDSLLTNPDPVYGGGYRMVRNAVLRHGVAAVLDSICDRGALP